MSAKRKPTPSYVPHKQSGRGRLAWTDSLGFRQQNLLPGAFGSPESLAAKARLELELAAANNRPQVAPDEWDNAPMESFFASVKTDPTATACR